MQSSLTFYRALQQLCHVCKRGKKFSYRECVSSGHITGSSQIKLNTANYSSLKKVVISSHEAWLDKDLIAASFKTNVFFYTCAEKHEPFSLQSKI